MMKLLQLVEKGDKQGVEELIKKDGLPIDSNWSDYSLLRHALCKGKTDIVIYLLEQGCRINKTGKTNINTPLHMAVKGEYLDVIKVLLEKGAPIDQKNNAGETPLSFAIKTKNDDVINLIFEKLNSSEDGRNENFDEIHIACIKNRVTEVERLLRSGAPVNKPISINSPFWPYCTPLHLAVDCQHQQLVKRLLDFGADINIKNTKGMTPLHMAVQLKNHMIVTIILDALKRRGEFVNMADDRGFSHLHAVCTTQDVNIVQSFLKPGVDINSQVSRGLPDWAGFTPLHFAVTYGCKPIIKLLLDNGADISIKNADEKSPLHLALKEDKRMIADMLISRQSTSSKLVNPVDEYGFSHFHATCMSKHYKIVQAYLDQGEPVNQTTNSPRWPMYTPLHFAVENKYEDTVKLLLERGANVNACTSNGFTPLHMAARNGKEKIVDLLIEYGANVNCASKREFTTPLHLAVIGQFAGIVETLLKNEADVKAQTEAGETPLHMIARGAFKLLDHVRIKNYIKIITSFMDADCDIDILDRQGKTPLFRSGENLNSSGTYALLHCGADINLAEGATDNFTDVESIRAVSSATVVAVFEKYKEKVRLLNIPVNKLEEMSNDPQYDDTEFRNFCGFFPPDFARFCMKELISMQNVQIDTYTSLYSILFKNPIEMTYHVSNEVLKKMLSSRKFDKSYPHYGFLIRMQYRKGNAMKIILEPCKSALNLIAKVNLPDNCSESILKHLTKQELKKLSDAIFGTN